MKTITWEPGTNSELDQEFEKLREAQYKNSNHRLWKNYSKDSFKSAIALTICWSKTGDPELCSSIASRPCWPKDAYRILNRLWKIEDIRKSNAPSSMSKSFGHTAYSQIDWLKKNTNYQLYFISRETANWEQWVARQFLNNHDLFFEIGEHQYLTCPNENDQSCWQRIIYNGNKEILNSWKKILL